VLRRQVTAAFGQMAIPVLAAWGEAAGVGYRYVWFFLVFCTITGECVSKCVLLHHHR
jgi:hypothetical protein